MKLIVGLGNPEKKYENTRHNCGFRAIDFYAAKNNLVFKNKYNSLYSEQIINNEKVIFVFSVNLFELQHTIKSYYGSDFNASKYLDRFFDLRVSLPPIDLNIYQINNSLNTNRTIDYTIFQVIKMYNMQLREMNKYIDTVNINKQ